jgi:hypothetical protein
LNELRPAAMTLEEIFLQLTQSDVAAEDDKTSAAAAKEPQA